jgi:SAM-dependent methyltransferase
MKYSKNKDIQIGTLVRMATQKKSLKDKFRSVIASVWLHRPRLILDTSRRVGNHRASGKMVPVNYCKEEISRKYIFERPGQKMKFIDVGARDGRLDYLLGIEQNMNFNSDLYVRNRQVFDSKYSYFGLDVFPEDNIEVLIGDICDPNFFEKHAGVTDSFDVVYSNNVFEHLQDPFVAARNLLNICRTGGLIITIVPFSQRFHESPDDFFRYTHRGVERLFQNAGSVLVHESGYDIIGRRNNWQGSGLHFDLVPTDRFGAWRETWYTVCIMEKC